MLSTRSIILFFCSLALLSHSCNTSSNFSELKEGGSAFVVGKSHRADQGHQGQHIEKGDIPYSHVGIVRFVEKDVYVIEATPSGGVIQTLLYEFMHKAEKVEGKPLIAVGRLKPEYQYLVPRAVERAANQLGRPYDYAFDEENDDYYCSELVRFSYLDSLENPIFPPISMTFKNRETGETEAY